MDKRFAVKSTTSKCQCENLIQRFQWLRVTQLYSLDIAQSEMTKIHTIYSYEKSKYTRLVAM